MARSIAREIALKGVYALSCGGNGDANGIWSMTHDTKLERRDKRQADELMQFVWEKRNLLDRCISPLLKSWKLSRLDKVDLCILRVAIYEIIFKKDLPDSIAINEAVELAKLFSGDQASAFINGVLGTFYRQKETGTLQVAKHVMSPDQIKPLDNQDEKIGSEPQTVLKGTSEPSSNELNNTGLITPSPEILQRIEDDEKKYMEWMHEKENSDQYNATNIIETNEYLAGTPLLSNYTNDSEESEK